MALKEGALNISMVSRGFLGSQIQHLRTTKYNEFEVISMAFLTIEATFDKDGRLHIEGPVDLKGKRVLITVLPGDDYEISSGHYSALMSEEVLAREWDLPEEDEAWAHL
jgi:hypothetical protein